VALSSLVNHHHFSFQPPSPLHVEEVGKKDATANVAEPSPSSDSSKRHKPDGADTASVDQAEGAAAMDVEENASSDPEVNRYLSEPMLCRDSTREQVPQRLVMLYQDAGVQNVSDTVCVVLHLLMLETGFLVNLCWCFCQAE
jgi:hypothetical protein